MQMLHKVLTWTLRRQQPVSSAARNNRNFIPLTVSYNETNLSVVLIVI